MDPKENGSLPAAPFYKSEYDAGGKHQFIWQEGLTKREVFAMQAPELPDWFAEAQGHAHNAPGYPKTAGEWCDDCKAGCDCSGAPGCEVRQESRKKQEAFKFQFAMGVRAKWAVAWADALLTELAKEA
jgi:hypothetical protein